MAHDIYTKLHKGPNVYITEKLYDAGLYVEKLASEDDLMKLSAIIHDAALELTRHAKSINAEFCLADNLPQDMALFSAVWGQCLSLSELLQHILESICLTFDASVDEEHILEAVLVRIFTRGIRTFAEINTLLQHGYPYGANSLTRNLFELWCILTFVGKYGAKTAVAYYEATGNDMISKNEYEWAKVAGVFDENSRISLIDIRRKCGLDSTTNKEFYSFSCKYTHGAPQIVNHEVGETKEHIYDMGGSSYGLEVPGINSAILIVSMLVELSHTFIKDDLILCIDLCQNLVDILKKAYLDTAARIASCTDEG